MAKGSVDREVDDRSDGLTTFEFKLLNLVALLLVRERKQTEQIDLLNRAGFESADIATLLGTTRNTVSVEISKQKKAREEKQSKKQSKKKRKKVKKVK